LRGHEAQFKPGSVASDWPLITIVLFTKTGPQCISIRCIIAVSLAQEAVHAAAAENVDPIFVRSSTRRSRRTREYDSLRD